MQRTYIWSEVQSVGRWVARGPRYLSIGQSAGDEDRHVADHSLSYFSRDGGEIIGIGLFATKHDYRVLRRFSWNLQADWDLFREQKKAEHTMAQPISINTHYWTLASAAAKEAESIASDVRKMLLGHKDITSSSVENSPVGTAPPAPIMAIQEWYAVRCLHGYIERNGLAKPTEETSQSWLPRVDRMNEMADCVELNPEVVTECYFCDPFSYVEELSHEKRTGLPDSLFDREFGQPSNEFH